MTDDLSPDAIEDRLTGAFGRPLRVLDEIDSTNEEAWRWVEDGAPEGAVVAADHQTSGRGRRGRSWVAPAGTGLLFSVVLHPAFDGEGLSLLTTALGVACAESIQEEANLPVRLKWPNDVVCRGRKLAGILVEGRGRGGDTAIVAGVGINVGMAPSDLPGDLPWPATSIAIEKEDTEVQRPRLLARCLYSFERLYGGLGKPEARADVVRRATRLSDVIGAEIRIRYPDGGSVEGVAAAIAPGGELIVVSGGKRVEVAAGEIENVRHV